MTRLYLDLETYNEEPISRGANRYAETVKITLFAYAIDDEPATVWDRTSGVSMPADLKRAIIDPTTTFVAHNSGFDRIMLKRFNPRFADPTNWEDTMVRALAHGLPGSLETLCALFGIAADKAKDKDGKRLVQMFCKPHDSWKVRILDRNTHPEDWSAFVNYARLDVEAMRELDKKLPRRNWTEAEIALWRMDQRINDRGFQIDTELVEAAIAAVEIEQKRLKKKTKEMTNGALESTTQRDAFLYEVLLGHGIVLPDARASTLERWIENPDTPEPAKELMRTRLQATTSSTAKYKKLREVVSSDGRLRGTLQFCGASRTGRYAGRAFQPQNLPRPTLKQGEIETGIEALKGGCADVLVDDLMALASSALRGCIIAPKGKKLVVSDLSNIEGRVQAWIAGETWKLKAFRDYDNGDGHDLYAVAYSKMFRVTPESVMEDKKRGGNQRQVGKTAELACLGAETLVLTNKGIIPIVNVTTQHKVWDGVAWVRHKGLVYRGLKKTIRLDGIRLTPDHLVLTGQTWNPASRLASNGKTLSRALATGSENLPSLGSKTGTLGVLTILWCNALAARHPIRFFCTTCSKVVAHAVMSALRNKRNIGRRATVYTAGCAKTSRIAVGSSIECPPVCKGVITQKRACTPTMEGEAYTFASHGEKAVGYFWNTLSLWKGGIIRLWSLTVSMWIRVMSLVTCVLSPALLMHLTNEACKRCRNELMSLRPVFDIAHAGPRNAFTIVTNSGFLIAHNCGYGGGAGSFVTFATAFGIDLNALAEEAYPLIDARILDEASGMWEWAVKKKRTLKLEKKTFVVMDSFKRQWREAHPQITMMWGGLEDAVRMAIAQPRKPMKIKTLVVEFTGKWLYIRLPSGRFLSYPDAKVGEDGQISFMGVSQFTKKWERIKTYGGKLFENVVQAIARDVMLYNMPAIEDAGYEIVLSVHDEMLTETPDSPEFNVDGLSALLAANTKWSTGLPLAAAGFESYRYKKD